MNEKKNVEWPRLRADCSVLTDQHFQDNDICLLDHRITAVTVILWFVYILDGQAASLIVFIMVASVLMPIGPCLNHTIFNAETCPGYGKKRIASLVNLFTIKLNDFAAIVLVCSLYIFLFLTGLVIGTAWMIFWSLIMVANFCPVVLLPDLKFLVVRPLCPSQPFQREKRTIGKQTFRKGKVRKNE